MGIEEKLRKQAIKKIIDDLQELGPAEMEYIGHAIISILENQILIHRGLNKNGKPVVTAALTKSHNKEY